MPKLKKKKVLVLLSGGVDSAVAAALLAKQGYSVTAVFMILNKSKNSENGKSSAQIVARKLKIPLQVVDLRRDFQKKIINHLVREYASGRTPNPCVACNQGIKFGVMLKKALASGFDFVASGHYVKSAKCKVQSAKLSFKLFKAKDQKKDQSYFLYTLTQEKLRHLLFPLGDYAKTEARALAKKQGLPVFDRRESQDLCFIAGQKVADFLKKHLKVKTGKIVEIASGKTVGEHFGLPFYTIGQRKNIGIGGIGPFYVTAFDVAKNILFVSNNKNDPALFGKKLKVEKVSWIAGRPPKFPLKCRVKIRSMHTPAAAIVKTQNNILRVDFEKPQKAITPGQAAVFYQQDEVLGGGIICA